MTGSCMRDPFAPNSNRNPGNAGERGLVDGGVIEVERNSNP